MVPPPGSTGDEFPDFDKMTFEEQMAWLESLAKRQGARTEELTTAANIDVPVPENADVNEPGYVPFEGSRSAREAKEGKSAAPVPEPQPPVERPAAKSAPAELPASEPAPVETQPAEEFPAAEWDAAEAMDPMQWLDSLTAQSGEQLGDLGDLFAGTGAQEPEELGEFGDLFSGFEGAAEVPELPAEPEPEPAPPAETGQPGAGTEASVDDLLGGMDPMAWLESLAKRQGARTEELTTSADLNVAVPEDAVIDEPGYVPFEGSRSAREIAKPPQPEAVPEPESPVQVPSEPAFEEPAPSEASATDLAWENAAEMGSELSLEFAEPLELPPLEEPALSGEMDELLGGADPMAWLESLAKRQGASDEEFMTLADLEVPEVPAGTVIDEPGYVPFSALDIRPSAPAVEPEPPAPEPVEELAVEPEPEVLDESLSWLEDLAAEPAEGLSQYLTFEDEQAESVAESVVETVEEVEVKPEPPALAAKPSAVDPLHGMTDEDVAYAQAHGLLTGEQELAWLKRQAAKLAETRDTQQWIEPEPGEVAPAEMAAELPPWLQDMRPEAGEEVAAAPQSLIDEFSLLSETSDVSDWLKETAPEGETGQPGPAIPAELSLDEGVESLWAEEPHQEAFTPESELIPDSELAAFLRGDLAPEEPDLLAEALDSEYQRRVEGDESEPSWYTAAVAQAAADAPSIQETELQAPVQTEDIRTEPTLSAPAAGDMPDWLMEGQGEAAAPVPVDADMPAWLKEEPSAPAEAAPGDVPAWLAEEPELPAAAPAESMPDWLTEMERPVSSEAPGVDWLGEEEKPAPPVPPAPPVVPPAAVKPKVEPPAAPVVKPAPQPAPAAQAVPVSQARPEPPVPVSKPAPAPLPAGELFEQYRSHLEKDPNDHVNRLAFARALRSGEALVPSLDQYETLIDSSQLLQDVSEDLSNLVGEHPEVPRVRRLLGDVYMRRGMLQEALNAYRSALDRL